MRFMIATKIVLALAKGFRSPAHTVGNIFEGFLALSWVSHHAAGRTTFASSPALEETDGIQQLGKPIDDVVWPHPLLFLRTLV